MMLAVDFFMLRTQGSHRVCVKEASLWSLAWFAVAMVFAGWYWWYVASRHGRKMSDLKTLQFITGSMPRRCVWRRIYGKSTTITTP